MTCSTRRSPVTWLRNAACVALLAAASACVFMPPAGVDVAASEGTAPVSAPDPAAPRLPVLSMREFHAVSSEQEVLGEVQVLFARFENTFVGIARRHNLGYESLRNANPNVDAWLPGEDTPVYLPTMTVMPDAPRDGIVLNLPSMRLLYFEAEALEADAPASADAPTYSVTSHPVGIGREGWSTPIGKGEVTDKARDPTWFPPASVRAEHAALGDPLPAVEIGRAHV